MTPLHTIMTAAKTASRAKPAFWTGAANITETINATSMTVTATARTSVPNGSPTRWAITSAWCTAAYTQPNRTITAAIVATLPCPAKVIMTKTSQAKAGQVHDHHGNPAEIG